MPCAESARGADFKATRLVERNDDGIRGIESRNVLAVNRHRVFAVNKKGTGEAYFAIDANFGMGKGSGCVRSLEAAAAEEPKKGDRGRGQVTQSRCALTHVPNRQCCSSEVSSPASPAAAAAQLYCNVWHLTRRADSASSDLMQLVLAPSFTQRHESFSSSSSCYDALQHVAATVCDCMQPPHTRVRHTTRAQWRRLVCDTHVTQL